MSTNIDIDNNNSNYHTNLSSHYKKLEISEKIKELGFITFFAIDTRTNSIIIEFKNEHHQQSKMKKKVIGPVDINNWTKFSDKVVKELVSPPIEIDRSKAMLIKGNLDVEYDNIIDILLTKNNNKNNLSGISDIYGNVNYNNNNSINNNFLNGKQQSQQEEEEEQQSEELQHKIITMVMKIEPQIF
jgi:hypothetical protein